MGDLLLQFFEKNASASDYEVTVVTHCGTTVYEVLDVRVIDHPTKKFLALETSNSTVYVDADGICSFQHS